MIGNKKSQILVLVFVAAITHAQYLPENTTKFVDDSEPECDKTIRPEACRFGRRIYKLIDFDGDMNSVKECHTSCNDTYTSNYATSSCVIGCELEMAASNDHQEKSGINMEEASLLMQAKLDQLFSHWMFEMLTGFDVFNEWYDSDIEESKPDVSTYVVIEQSDDQLFITSYQTGKLTGKAGDYQETNIEATVDQPDSTMKEALDEETDYFSDGLSWDILCFTMLSSIGALIWLVMYVLVAAPKRRLVKKEIKALPPLDFYESKSEVAGVHGKQVEKMELPPKYDI